ncbi:MAG: peptidylprolyl isomerase [Chloroflexota bacterium]|nr:peptidylprolyl isomerase [Chloroflexota bacterium]
MAKKKRRQRPAPLPPRSRRRGWSREFRLQLLVVAGFALLLAIVGGMVGWGKYQDVVGPPRSRALQVGETTFNLDYFTRRLKFYVESGGLQGLTDPQKVAQTIATVMGILQQEELLRQKAPVDLGLSASPDEIDEQIATRLKVSRDDPEAFRKAYQEELKRSHLSDKEYRQMIEANVLGTKVQQTYSSSVPATMEQVRIRALLVGTEDEAKSVLERLDAGEDFGDLARQLSLDPTAKDNGGERGWLARDELDLASGPVVFALEVGGHSQPIAGPGGQFIVQVEERQPDMAVTDQQRSTLAASYFTYWLEEQRTLIPRAEYVSTNSDKLSWVVVRAFG